MNLEESISRRRFQQVLGLGALSAAGSTRAMTQGRARSCVLIWLGGGMCHVDTFDPKPVGDPATQKPGSAYPSIPTAIPGVRVCEHLELTAKLLDRGAIIRSLNHPLKIDHADSTNLMKTGRLTSGTVVYPSLGSLVSHELGPRVEDVPPYVVMGFPNVTRGPGFLGGRYSYVYLTDPRSGPSGLRRPYDLTEDREHRRFELLDVLRRDDYQNVAARDYDEAIGQAKRFMKGSFSKVFDLDAEPGYIRDRYGSHFGQRCLLARRLVESGTRFVEVAYDLNFKNGTGWDTHRHGQAKQHLLIHDLDQSLSALVRDLEMRGLLDETLVVVATEFGRPPEFDAQGGRGHQSAAFCAAMFGGGLRSGQVIGATDEFGRKIVERPVSVPDFHATILSALGVNPHKDLYDGKRPIPITDHGQPIAELFA
ncbi:MAG: DUF1501 domain-containing protein [Limisphaerales bacterium]